jgi:hypothetical protein
VAARASEKQARERAADQPDVSADEELVR